MAGVMQSFLSSVEPTRADLDGSTIPLFFSLRAAALMEEQTGTSYPKLVRQLFQVPDEEGETSALPMEHQAAVIACLIHEGQRVSGETPESVDALQEAILQMHMEQVNQLILAATQEILFKSRKVKPSKNA